MGAAHSSVRETKTCFQEVQGSQKGRQLKRQILACVSSDVTDTRKGFIKGGMDMDVSSIIQKSGQAGSLGCRDK